MSQINQANVLLYVKMLTAIPQLQLCAVQPLDGSEARLVAMFTQEVEQEMNQDCDSILFCTNTFGKTAPSEEYTLATLLCPVSQTILEYYEDTAELPQFVVHVLEMGQLIGREIALDLVLSESLTQVQNTLHVKSVDELPRKPHKLFKALSIDELEVYKTAQQGEV